MLNFVILFSVIVLTTGNGLTGITGSFEVCTLQCTNNGQTSQPGSASVIRGKSGPRGEKGAQGQQGIKGEPGDNCDLSRIVQLQNQFVQLQGIVTKTKQIARKSVVGWNDCGELFDNGFSEDGVYTITTGNIPFQTYCDMGSGGWTVFQRRFDGSTDFRQNFETFTHGFGDVENEYWLGLEKMHQLTKIGNWTLRIELLAYDNDHAYAEYSDFSIGEGPGYRLHVGTYNGTAGDCLVYHNGMKFSTYDKDQDESGQHCSNVNNLGSWWFKSCNRCNLNSFVYGNAETRIYKGMNYYEFKGESTSLKATKLMLRRR